MPKITRYTSITLNPQEMSILHKMLNRLMDKEVLSEEECRIKEKVEGLKDCYLMAHDPEEGVSY